MSGFAPVGKPEPGPFEELAPDVAELGIDGKDEVASGETDHDDSASDAAVGECIAIAAMTAAPAATASTSILNQAAGKNIG